MKRFVASGFGPRLDVPVHVHVHGRVFRLGSFASPQPAARLTELAGNALAHLAGRRVVLGGIQMEQRDGIGSKHPLGVVLSLAGVACP